MNLHTRPTGKYFEELNISERFQTPSRTVTKEDISTTATLYGDRKAVHSAHMCIGEIMAGKIRAQCRQKACEIYSIY